MHEFGLIDWLARWLSSLALVLGTYNPYAMSYYHWVSDVPGFVSIKVLVGITLLILHVVAALSTIRSLGVIGIGLLTASFASGAWVLIENGVLYVEDSRIFTLTLLVILANIYGIGLSWSHLRNRLSGQVDSTDVTFNSPV
jgi:hypothetical protein